MSWVMVLLILVLLLIMIYLIVCDLCIGIILRTAAKCESITFTEQSESIITKI